MQVERQTPHSALRNPHSTEPGAVMGTASYMSPEQARAAVLQGDTAKAKQMYEEFFKLWKDAHADLPMLIEAKKEYEKVK